MANNDQTPKVSIKKQARCYDTEAWQASTDQAYEALLEAKRLNQQALRRITAYVEGWLRD